tara:strand:+ start:6944 stop:7144 length:201 start_codon:yes stop_codon:yes gene_type:complete
MLTKTLEGLTLPHSVKDIDVDLDPDLAQKHHVRGVPTLVLIDDKGNEVRRSVGMLSETQLKEWAGE